ncbi:hypothetical protein D6827_01730 [Candidatus Parcubacteria bacterium]|nr:MAG: hypothetical protein D6827_01730 [Candidatus Parcubacteria bacterium]
MKTQTPKTAAERELSKRGIMPIFPVLHGNDIEEWDRNFKKALDMLDAYPDAYNLFRLLQKTAHAMRREFSNSPDWRSYTPVNVDYIAIANYAIALTKLNELERKVREYEWPEEVID